MAECTTCFKVNRDEDLSRAISAARQKAVADQKPIAIVEENGEYILMDAFYAYSNGMIVKQTVSHL